jgi:hypothetical protein
MASTILSQPSRDSAIRIDDGAVEYCEHSPMLRTAQFVSYRAPHHTTPFRRANWANLSQIRKIHHQNPLQQKQSTDTGVNRIKMQGNRENQPPKHEMVHFKSLLSEVRRFGDFRTVLHTGLYSQVVAMEIPVGGDIGDEVCILRSDF